MAKQHKIQRDPRNGNYFIRLQVEGTRQYCNLGPLLIEARHNLARLKKGIVAGELAPTTVGNGNEHFPPATPGNAEEGKPNDLLLSELIELHLNWVKHNRAAGTLELYTAYENHFLHFVGDRPVSTITRLMMEDFFAWAREHHSKSNNGGIVFVQQVKSMFLWAQEMDVCPCPISKFPKVAEMPPETKRFSDEELSKLLSHAPPEFSDFRDMIVFGLHTGLRPQELRELTRPQLHHDGNGNYSVFIQNHKTSKTAHEPKPRSVPLTPEAKDIAIRRLAAHPNSDHVFLNGHGTPYSSRTFRQRLRRWCKQAGIKPRPPYALRHTFGSIEAEANINQTVIGQMMGHSQLRTTARYISNNAAHHRVAVSAIGSRIAKLTTALLILAATAHACFAVATGKGGVFGG